MARKFNVGRQNEVLLNDKHNHLYEIIKKPIITPEIIVIRFPNIVTKTSFKVLVAIIMILHFFVYILANGILLSIESTVIGWKYPWNRCIILTYYDLFTPKEMFIQHEKNNDYRNP